MSPLDGRRVSGHPILWLIIEPELVFEDRLDKMNTKTCEKVNETEANFSRDLHLFLTLEYYSSIAIKPPCGEHRLI